MINRLKRMKETLANCIEGQLGNLQNVDAKELGEVVDMVKDLEEAIYYCTITKSMDEAEKKEKNQEHHHYYTTPMYYDGGNSRNYTPMHYRDMDRMSNRMYYPMHDNEMGYYDETMYYQGQPRDSQGRFSDRRNYNGNGSSNSGNSNETRNYTEMEIPMNLRDPREGKSHMMRRTYMESKEMHKDKATKIKELEAYAKELGEDLVEMIEDASPEEKQILEKKISSLASKIAAIK